MGLFAFGPSKNRGPRPTRDMARLAGGRLDGGVWVSLRLHPTSAKFATSSAYGVACDERNTKTRKSLRCGGADLSIQQTIPSSETSLACPNKWGACSTITGHFTTIQTLKQNFGVLFKCVQHAHSTLGALLLLPRPRQCFLRLYSDHFAGDGGGQVIHLVAPSFVFDVRRFLPAGWQAAGDCEAPGAAHNEGRVLTTFRRLL
jgi:hypothetical protein